MWEHASLITLLGLVTLAAPLLLMCLLGGSSLIGWRLREETTNHACQAAIVTGLLAALAILVLMLLQGTRLEAIDIGEWVVLPHYHFR